MTLAIKASGLAKAYGDVVALNGIDIEVEQGTVLGLLGPNGSGKTTTVRILATLLQADSGSASVGGFDVATQPDEVRSVIGLTGQYAAVDEYLTGRENLELFGRLFHLSKFDAAKRAAELLDRFDLSDAADRGIKGYSGGMRRRLDLAASLIGRPNVLFLDEPTTGLDPRSRQGMWEVIEDLIAEGTTVLLTTQYLEEADQLANRIVVLDHGNVIAKGTSNELKSQVGGDRIEIVVESVGDVANAAGLIQEFGSAPAITEDLTKTILLPVAGGSTAIVNIVRKLDENKISIADIALRRPTLDDVFLSLTGHATENTEEVSKPAKGRRGRKARS
ncbi:putative multidrug ABC transporter ATP-binding protein [freshwater metagenome]|jgi:ABC-2 type transport system ATP-binding protein|uniref:Putative multidrug ABC transporter ATP-binding protein n=1 Tax=freshwater metagenome TaxID=449393 RepID=A0A094Q815_9ZZZZ